MRILALCCLGLLAQEAMAQETVRVEVAHPIVRVAEGGKKVALLVPEAVIVTDQDKKFLLVVNDKDVVEYRPVKLGPIEGKLRVIEPLKIVRAEKGVRLAGPDETGEGSLKAGDRVIVRGLQRVRPGTKVEAKTASIP
jgi:multidrug efflux pump subunit AcrA (membrane-fusion protein)